MPPRIPWQLYWVDRPCSWGTPAVQTSCVWRVVDPSHGGDRGAGDRRGHCPRLVAPGISHRDLAHHRGGLLARYANYAVYAVGQPCHRPPSGWSLEFGTAGGNRAPVGAAQASPALPTTMVEFDAFVSSY